MLSLNCIRAIFRRYIPKFKAEKPYEGRIEPFKIAGNVYFVGTYQASGHLIDTGDGLILIDAGYANTVYLFLESIWELGFDPRDIKYIIHSHWHWDHTEGTEAIAKLSGASVLLIAKLKKKSRQDVVNAVVFRVVFTNNSSCGLSAW